MNGLCNIPALTVNPSIPEGDDPVGHAGDLNRVGHEDERRPSLAVEREEEIEDRLAVHGIEISGGLVGEDDLRIVHQCPADGDALFLSTRELVREVAASPRKTDALEQRSRPLVGPGGPLSVRRET